MCAAVLMLAVLTCVVSGETAPETFLRIRLWGKLLLSRLRSTFYSDRERLRV